MLKKIVYSALLCAILLLALIYFFSAGLFKGIGLNIPKVKFSNMESHGFYGSAEKVVYSIRGYPLLIGSLSWNADMLSFFTLSPCINFSTISKSSKSEGKACKNYFSEKLSFENVKLSLSAGEVAEISGFSIAGEFHGHIAQLAINDLSLNKLIEGNIIWHNAQFFNGEDWLSLGDILLRVEQLPYNDLIIRWSDADFDKQPFDPDIDIDISTVFKGNKLLSIDGIIFPQKNYSPALLDTLALIGEKDNDGRFVIVYRE